MPKTYTVKEVADILGFSTNSIYTFLKEKRIRGVRIGKGRFRIPEEELARVLHLSKKSIAPSPAPSGHDYVAPAEPVLSETPVTPEGDAVFMLPRRDQPDEDHGVLIAPNIFDWFVGLGAVIAGIGLFVFNSSLTSEVFPRMELVYPIIRLVLIACGAGVLISSLLRSARVWRKVFLIALSVLGFFNAFGLIKSGDIDGGALYGSLALVIAIVNIVPFGGIAALGIYVSLVVFLIPAVMVFFPMDTHMQSFATLIGLPPLFIGMGSMLAAVLLLVIFWVGYAGNRMLFLIAVWTLTIGDIAMAIWYGHLQYWSRAFFVMVVGTFTALLPYWWPLQQKLSRRHKLMLHGLFICIGFVLVLAILIVYLLQQSIWVNREREVMNKIHLGHSQLNNAATSVQSTLVVAASNVDFVTSIVKADIVMLNKYSKIIYESNPNIRRLVFLDKDGQGIALYPYGTFDEPNFSYRDYYQQTKNTGKPYISDVFQAKSDQAGRYVLVIAVPLYDAKEAFAGVITASMDLDRLGLQLNQIAAGGQGEYFVVADAKGIILSHPNTELIGTKVPKDDPLMLALKGESGIKQGVMIEKISGMMGYSYVSELRWAISLRIPSEKVFDLAATEIWIVFGVACSLIGVGIAMISYIRSRAISGREGGP